MYGVLLIEGESHVSDHEVTRSYTILTFGGLSGEEEDEQIGDYNQTMTTEALRIKLDNLQREVQSLQVENRKLRAATERDQGEESHVTLRRVPIILR